MSGDLTARDVIAREVHLQVPTLQHGPIGTEFVADVVLAALAAAGWRLERDDQWEWGVLPENGIMSEDPEDFYRDRDDAKWVADHWDRAMVVRRRPAGEWEVAP